MKFIALFLPVIMIVGAGHSAVFACAGGSAVCTVVDPTGSALNIRSAPNGKIIGTAKNGAKLEFIDHQTVMGKKWARVGRYDPNTGALDAISAYLYASYLDCDADLTKATSDKTVQCTVQDPTGTPLNAREEPGGLIIGSVRTGQRVRVFSTKMHEGKLWAASYREAADNPVGWVYDPYLKCAEDSQ